MPRTGIGLPCCTSLTDVKLSLLISLANRLSHDPESILGGNYLHASVPDLLEDGESTRQILHRLRRSSRSECCALENHTASATAHALRKGLQEALGRSSEEPGGSLPLARVSIEEEQYLHYRYANMLASRENITPSANPEQNCCLLSSGRKAGSVMGSRIPRDSSHEARSASTSSSAKAEPSPCDKCKDVFSNRGAVAYSLRRSSGIAG